MNGPTDAVIAVTYRCNAKCAMCNIWKTSEHNEMEPSHYSKLPKSLRTINITGGEPFLRKGLIEIIQVIHNTLPRARIVFSTNGLMTNHIVEAIEEVRDFHTRIGVGVSIDGIGEIHDRIRGIQGVFSKALATIEALKSAGVADLRIGMTIVPENMAQIQEVYDLSRDLGIELTMTYAHNSEIYFGKIDNAGSTDLTSGRDSIQNIVDSLLSSFSIKNWLRAFHTAGLIDSSIRRALDGHCQAGSRHFFMNPAGHVYPCVVLDKKIGNLAEASKWQEMIGSDMKHDVLTLVGRCRKDCWMVCNTKSLILSNPIGIGCWVVKNKYLTHTTDEYQSKTGLS